MKISFLKQKWQWHNINLTNKIPAQHPVTVLSSSLSGNSDPVLLLFEDVLYIKHQMDISIRNPWLGYLIRLSIKPLFSLWSLLFHRHDHWQWLLQPPYSEHFCCEKSWYSIMISLPWTLSCWGDRMTMTWKTHIHLNDKLAHGWAYDSWQTGSVCIFVYLCQVSQAMSIVFPVWQQLLFYNTAGLSINIHF